MTISSESMAILVDSIFFEISFLGLECTHTCMYNAIHHTIVHISVVAPYTLQRGVYRNTLNGKLLK